MATEQRDDLISRKAILAEYDRVHIGPPGGARKLIENAPAVEAAPVVHAHWINGHIIHNGDVVGKFIECSHCEDTLDVKTDEERVRLKDEFTFCPFCGAIMDGVAGDG